MRITQCRFCKGPLQSIVSLGSMPIVNYFPSLKEVAGEKKYPLELCVCGTCDLVQLGFIVAPEKIFRSYHFLTSASKPLVAHLVSLADTCITDFGVTPRSKVLDIGCNDGSLLLHFKKCDLQTIGVEPALSMAKLAASRGVDVIGEFFTSNQARRLRARFGQFDLIFATRVLANIVDLDDFMSGVKLLLAPQGIFVVEVSSLSEMISKFQFDAIYHEHYSYFSLATLGKILQKHDLSIVKLEKSLFQGGELRIFACQPSRVDKKLRMEEGIAKSDYIRFAKEVTSIRRNLRSVFADLKGARIAGFGAPAKAVTLLNYCDLGRDVIEYIVDSTPIKQGRLLPGVHIPIFPEEYLKEKPVDYVFLLAWNYKDQIIKKIKRLTPKGTNIIIPFPKLEVISL